MKPVKVEPLNNHSYRLRKMYKGKQYSVVVPYLPDDKQAMKLILECIDTTPVNNKTITVKSVFDDAMAEKTKLRSVNTVSRLKTDFKRYISESFQNKKIQDIDYLYLKKYTIDIINSEKPKVKGFLNYKSVLNSIFNYALEHEYIVVNPLNKFNNKDYIHLCTPTEKKAENKAMTPTQIEAMKKTAYDRMSKNEACSLTTPYMFLLSTLTGMRAGELCALKWSDITKDNIHIHAQQLQNHNTGELIYANWTKNEKGIPQGGRYFPVTNDIKKLLNKLKKAQKKYGIVSDYVFAYKDGSWVSENNYVVYLREITKASGYTICNNHAIRMYFNSLNI